MVEGPALALASVRVRALKALPIPQASCIISDRDKLTSNLLMDGDVYHTKRCGGLLLPPVSQPDHTSHVLINYRIPMNAADTSAVLRRCPENNNRARS